MKPLSRQQREAIREEVAFFRHHNADGEDALAECVDMALDAEQYWREAVAKVEPAHAGSCCFCREDFGESPSVSGPAHHKPDCPWLLAQED